MAALLQQKTRKAYLVFYPLAAFWAAMAVPLWISQYLGLFDFGLTSSDHAHEMIYGFALAVITGFLLNGCSKASLLLLSLLWGLGRIVPFWNDTPIVLVQGLHLSFPLLLAYLAAMPLFRNAKTWRNLAFAPILAAFIIGEIVYQFSPDKGILLGLNLVCAMVYMMGGRVVTAVTNGFIQRMDDHLKPGAQSYWEEKGFFALLCLVIGDLSGFELISMAGGVALSLCLAMRIYRWEPWRLWTNPQCLWLHLGFAWLWVGITLRLFGLVLDGPAAILGIHSITIAALGTLTLTIMSRTTLQRLRLPMRIPKTILTALAAINLSIITRILMELQGDVEPWAQISAISYSVAFVIFLCWIILTPKKK